MSVIFCLTSLTALIARIRAVFHQLSRDIMLHITPIIAINESEIELDFVRAAGPGGQHVNKTASAVQLRFDARSSPSLPDDVRARLIRLAGNRVTEDGTLIITARRFRSQERNRQDAVDRLVELIRKAAEEPKLRRKTKPARAAKRRRLNAKRRRSQTKRLRRPVSHHED
jgi:ribosome-associated protein